MFIEIEPIACAHIAAFYQQRWERQKCIAFNLLRRGYAQCAAGRIEAVVNNLYD